ncbi:hypothetical protein [Nitrospirillum sp. BR 11163]|uniref:hypothetical protein n=1 Tax=Nitrospirillum sp. BR 11163 TaxID=3104323 RepID=UPI002AFE3D43|nr:hypothetical protein [Nitrospirillum sp. BR 11163]MEA1675249.1 hypothetical protein [Nitrospirillum sp. BR 11163]
MYTAYFDKSGQHDEAGHMVRISVAGCIASDEQWAALSSQWASAISHCGISMFHMAEFESGRGEFSGKINGRTGEGKALLGQLLDIMVEHVPLFVGTFRDFEKVGGPIHAEYRKGVSDILKTLALNSEVRSGYPIRVVFAKHQAYSAGDVSSFRATIDHEKVRFSDVGVGEPRDTVPLQAADIFAYEFSRHVRYSDRPMRFPFSYIITGARAKGGKVMMELYP